MYRQPFIRDGVEVVKTNVLDMVLGFLEILKLNTSFLHCLLSGEDQFFKSERQNECHQTINLADDF